MKYRTPRLPADGQIRVKGPAGEGVARLRNIGARGIGIAGVAHLSVGDRVELTMAGRRYFATTIWALGERAGLQLAAPLAEAEICAIRGVPSRDPSGASCRYSGTTLQFREL